MPRILTQPAHRVRKPKLAPRIGVSTQPIVSRARLSPDTQPSVRDEIAFNPSLAVPQGPQPYVDYGRTLTPEGGIHIRYKDIDQRLRHTLWRLLIWSAATGSEGWFLLHRSPVQSLAINLLLAVTIAAANWWIVRQPVEVYRTIELRAECMVLDGTDLFWKHMMESNPSIDKNADGDLIMTGIYGTRFIEYLTIRRFDDLDRMPEVFAHHLEDAIKQLWTPPGERWS